MAVYSSFSLQAAGYPGHREGGRHLSRRLQIYAGFALGVLIVLEGLLLYIREFAMMAGVVLHMVGGGIRRWRSGFTAHNICGLNITRRYHDEGSQGYAP